MQIVIDRKLTEGNTKQNASACGLHKLRRLDLDMARLGGFEPPTAWFVARYSIQLSYSRF